MPDNRIYSDEEAKNDLAKIIAQHTSGVKDAIPEQDDVDLALRFMTIIDHRYDD